MVGKGQVYQAFKLSGETVTQQAQVNVFFAIYEQGTTAPRQKSHSPRGRATVSGSGAMQSFGNLSGVKTGEGQLISQVQRFQSVAIPASELAKMNLTGTEGGQQIEEESSDNSSDQFADIPQQKEHAEEESKDPGVLKHKQEIKHLKE